MVTLDKSNRIKGIENRFNGSIKDLLYQMHWLEDMRHRDIALNLHIPRPTGPRYFCFYSTDREILEKIKSMLNAKQNIALRKMANKEWKGLFYLQIGSKEIFDDLINLGFTTNKALRFKLPAIPRKYTNHFIRGYFDGDGSVTYGHFRRKDRNSRMTPYVLTCFASANIAFLRKLSQLLTKNACMGQGYIDKKGYHLSYSKLDSTKLFCYMYKGVTKEQYLERKYRKFCKAINLGA